MRARSSSCISPWDTPRNSTDKRSVSADDEVFYDALPKTDNSWMEKEKRILSDFVSSPFSSLSEDSYLTALPAFARANKARAKTSFEASGHSLDESFWESPEFTQIFSPRTSTDSASSVRSINDEDISPWFTSRF